MTRFRGDDIPPVSDYAHWNEDAQLMWYQENRYDMEHAGEPLDDDDWYDTADDYDEDDPDEDLEALRDPEKEADDDHDTLTRGPFD